MLAACEAAVSGSGLKAKEVTAALKVLRSGAAPTPRLRAQVATLAARIDGQYLDLHESDSHTKKEARLFSQARAASALAYALSDEGNQLQQAIYEAVHSAPDELDDILRVATEALRQR